MEKRFIGNDMSKLYERVRRELGNDAIIVRTRTLTRDGADPLIELVAGPPPENPDDRLDLDLQRRLIEKTGARIGIEPARRRFTVEDLEAMLGDEQLQ
jgi:flagellar biosynthesis GTPase FlhF